MKKLIYILTIILSLAITGCKYNDVNYKNGPVEPDSISYESSSDGDPELPNMVPWWKFQ